MPDSLKMPLRYVLVILSVLIVTVPIFTRVQAQTLKNYALKIRTSDDLHKYFKYRGDSPILISGHRGGREPGFPENSIEGLNNVLKRMPAFFEIDPRLTKDSVIVLMHDATLDRTTTGTGMVKDYTWKELQKIRLRDSKGKVTPYAIPTLENVIKWSKGKTVINLDKKDVPLEMTAALIKKYNAESHVMLTVHNGREAKFCYSRFPKIMLSAFVRNQKEYDDISTCGVPWENMIAYVGPTFDEKNLEIIKMLHTKGVKCMVSFAPTHDKLLSKEERQGFYKMEIEKNPDIIESDFPVEVWEVIEQY